MTQKTIECSGCGAEDYKLLNPTTGEVECRFCRRKWTVPELVQKSETDRFLESQGLQPQNVQGNATEAFQKSQENAADAKSTGADSSARLPGCFKAILVVAGFALIFLIILGISCTVAARSIFG